MIWKNYIGTDFLVPEWICENIIDIGENEIQKGRSTHNTDYRNDWALQLEVVPEYNLSENFSSVNKAINHAIVEFCDKFTSGISVDNYTHEYHKFQKAEKGGGFYTWHFESTAKSVSDRAFVWMLYLNTVENGGKTEFYKTEDEIIEVKPEVGKFVFWPAGETHCHRSAPDLKETKYILTGWVNRK